MAVETLKLDHSPFDKIRIGNKTESERRAYSFEQVTTILNAAFQSTYDVFLPVLVQAYCGCRSPKSSTRQPMTSCKSTGNGA